MTDFNFMPSQNQSYLEMWPLENINLPYWRGWFNKNWPYSVALGVIYVCFIYFGQRIMKYRKPFNLQKPLAIWNFAMGTFSAVAFLRVFPELIYLMSKEDGLHRTACKIDEHGMSLAFWALIYTFSKAVILIDTVFIVLRKKKLILLHWYHHLSVLIITWFAYHSYIPLLRFAGNMNYFVHSWMYTYYGLRALEIKISKNVSLFVTILELIQMILGLFVTLYVIWQHYFGRGCIFSPSAIIVSCTIYSTLFVLFAKHFRTTAFKQRCDIRQKLF